MWIYGFSSDIRNSFIVWDGFTRQSVQYLRSAPRDSRPTHFDGARPLLSPTRVWILRRWRGWVTGYRIGWWKVMWPNQRLVRISRWQPWAASARKRIPRNHRLHHPQRPTQPPLKPSPPPQPAQPHQPHQPITPLSIIIVYSMPLLRLTTKGKRKEGERRVETVKKAIEEAEREGTYRYIVICNNT